MLPHVLVLLFGNVYCGYVCPFGALSELVGDVRAGGPALRPEAWRHVRVLKYGLLALLGLLFALTRDFGILASDPLIVFFGAQDPGWAFWLGLAGVALAFLFPRFWCRGLCPAGAFLALLNRVQVLRRILPRTHPGRCDLGVRTPRDLDCLCCDRCNRGPL